MSSEESIIQPIWTLSLSHYLECNPSLFLRAYAVASFSTAHSSWEESHGSKPGLAHVHYNLPPPNMMIQSIHTCQAQFLRIIPDHFQPGLPWPPYTKESTTKPVFSHTKHLQINNLHIFTIVFHSRHILFLHDLLIRLFFPFHMSDHHLAKGLSLSSVHASGIHSPWYPKLIFSTNIPFQTQNTPLQNCVPSLGSFPSPWTVYPDFDSCYSYFMPYRMTPSVRHRAIEVHYYYYYYYYYTTLFLSLGRT